MIADRDHIRRCPSWTRSNRLARALRTHAEDLAKDARAASAVEFAVIAPVILALLLSGVEVGRYINYTRKVSEIARATAGMLAQNKSGSVNLADLFFYNDSSMVIFPEVLKEAKQRGIPWYQNISFTIAFVKFFRTIPSCTKDCSYTAFLSWSYGAYPLSCYVPMLPAPDTADPTSTTLPTDTFGPGSLIVVQAAYWYTPLVGSSFIRKKFISRTYYLAPRYVSTISFDYSQGNYIVDCHM
ncbi:TadE/TadG family type IV pilus assembly protein [Methylobacterium nigriterrae]|uniref:TadE/TadG family type IV pilus assembly protein n=1 Tax=Methylobacterium nigriterrae TaxID=3127512 RepID=UPI003013E080